MQLLYREYQPSEALKPYVVTIWTMNSDGADDTLSPMQRCFPAGTIEWIITVRGKNMIGHDEGRWFDYPRSIITGFFDRASEWHSHGNAELFGVRLTPEGAMELFGTPLREFRNRFLDTDDFLGNKITPIVSNIISAPSVQERVFLLESFLHSQIRHKQIERNYFTEALRIIRREDDLHIADLSRKVYVGERQLQRSFRHYLGISPKSYFKVMRLYKAHQLGLIREDNYTNIAYRLGYADPAHFNRDFKNYFGVSPDQHFSTINMTWVA